jgi:hypothetical protein
MILVGDFRLRTALMEPSSCTTRIILLLVSAPSQFPDASENIIVLEDYDIHLV